MTTQNDSRFARALAGEAVIPPVLGMTFVPETALTDRGTSDGVITALARASADANLDFIFVPSWDAKAERLASVAIGAGAQPVWVVPGVLNPALEETGVVAGLRATIGDPESLRAALDRATATAIDEVARGASLEVGAIALADDIYGTTGPLVTPEYIRGALLPRYAAIVAAATTAGLTSVLHCDGSAPLPLVELREAGFTAIHPGGLSDREFEKLLVEGRRAQMRIIGGVMTRDLQSGTPRAVLTGTRLGMLARVGGLLLADDGGITSYEEYAALLAALAAARGPE